MAGPAKACTTGHRTNMASWSIPPTRPTLPRAAAPGGPENQWDAFHKAGRERVLARYTWERTAAGYLAVIEDMLADRPELPSRAADLYCCPT